MAAKPFQISYLIPDFHFVGAHLEVTGLFRVRKSSHGVLDDLTVKQNNLLKCGTKKILAENIETIKVLKS